MFSNQPVNLTLQVSSVFNQSWVNGCVIPQTGKSRNAGPHRQRIAGKSAALINRPQRRNLLHQLPPATVSAHRQAAADNLAKADQIRLHAENTGRRMIIQAEAGNNLVKNQDNAVLRAKAAHLGQKALGRRHHAHIAGHRLHNQAGHLALVGRQQLRQGGGVIVRADQSFRQQTGRHAGAGGHALGQQAAAAFHQQAVAVAVIAALKLHQLAAAGAAAGHTDGAHCGLRAGINHSQHFAGRVGLGN